MAGDRAFSVPRKLGRYELLGTLAKGGMAEILLGRLVGPLGFEKPVVIKRILPQLAASARFTQMFLEEARTVAEIRHPNVVQVHELGAEAGELFMVMEYLEGESVAGILARLWRENRRMEPVVAALIAAGACAGLHAAHELAGGDGRPLGLVHRDVSPSNLFVTYDGQVKVLDFGIAKTDRREHRTDAGMVKGKKPYMSPEQALAQPLDRRSDLFSLGIVLFEMCTMRRLFQRENLLLVYRAICEDPIPSPAEVRGDSGGDLDRICRKALARTPHGRYASAQAMRRDLLSFARTLSTGEPEELLATMMGELFADRVAEKSALRAQLEQGVEQLAWEPKPDTDLGATIPSVVVARRQHAGSRVAVRFTPLRKLGAMTAVALAGIIAYVAVSSRQASAGRALALQKAPPALAASPSLPEPATSGPVTPAPPASSPPPAPNPKRAIGGNPATRTRVAKARASLVAQASSTASAGIPAAPAPTFRRFD